MMSFITVAYSNARCVKYGGQNGGDKSSDGTVVTPNPSEAINENVPIIPMSTNEQAVTAIPTGPSYSLQGSFPTLGVQPGYIPGELLDSTLFWSPSDQLQTTRVPYFAWGEPILHQNTQIPIGYTTPGTIQGFPPLSINNMPIVLPAEQLNMGQHPSWPLPSYRFPAPPEFERID